MEKTKRDYYDSLYQAAAIVNSARTPEAVLQALVEAVVKGMSVKGCSLMLLTPDGKLLFHTATHGLSEQYIRKGPLSADKSLADALKGQPVAVLDATKDARVQYREQAKQEGIASMLSVPMLLRDKIIGVVRVYTAEPYRFAPEDIHFVGAVANLGAIALENARLYESLQRDYNALKHYYFPFL